MKHPGLGRLNIMRKDRMGNPDLDFPIAAAFGDRDFLASENGAEVVLKASKRFETGEAQLFKVKDCTHFMPQLYQFWQIIMFMFKSEGQQH